MCLLCIMNWDFIYHKTTFFTVTAGKTSNPTLFHYRLRLLRVTEHLNTLWLLYHPHNSGFRLLSARTWFMSFSA
jgi:hypothetical protein